MMWSEWSGWIFGNFKFGIYLLEKRAGIEEPISRQRCDPLMHSGKEMYPDFLMT